jgi:glycosyltransferase involved in cell wall biosynthesis
VLGRAAYRRAAKLVSASAGVAEELARLYGLHREEIVVIPNPIDTGFVLARSTEPLDLELEILADVPILLTIGRLEKVKNHVLLLRAFARVRRETAANLLIVGTGGLRQNLERLAEDLGIAHDVVFQGWLDNPFPLMRMSTAFVLSSHYEGFGNVLLEAFACGCPVVSTDCPFGPAEILGDPAAGILVPAQDENALATAILRVLRDDGLRTALAHRGRHRALEFETSRVIARYERTLESLLSHSTSRS